MIVENLAFVVEPFLVAILTSIMQVEARHGAFGAVRESSEIDRARFEDFVATSVE